MSASNVATSMLLNVTCMRVARAAERTAGGDRLIPVEKLQILHFDGSRPRTESSLQRPDDTRHCTPWDVNASPRKWIS